MSEEARCVVTLHKGVDTSRFMEDMKAVGSVSYTHLTLPTSDLV